MSWGSEEGAHMLMSLSYCELKRAATQGLALLSSLARGGPRPRETCCALGHWGGSK